MSETPAIITLLTDFGEEDSYVGAMKGVILSILPEAKLIDISHRVTPQNIRQAALILSNVYAYYPPHTVHLAVIDPGVGGPRRAIALEASHGRFVAPDNGVLTYVRLKESTSKAVLLENADYWLSTPSHTFHGRDIFSPVAAHLASGVPLTDLGPPVDEIVMLPMPSLIITPTSIQGQVVHIDRFGNVLTNIMSLRWVDDRTIEFNPITATPDREQTLYINARQAQVTCSWHKIKGLSQTYSQAGVGETLALVGSSGELEVAINQGNASEGLAIQVGDPITLYITP
jgi:S-adenosylmethionine hydrolase